MLYQTKRKQQINNFFRKKNQFISQEEAIEVTDVQELAIGEFIIEVIEEGTEEDLKEFKEVGKRFINEALVGHNEAANRIRTIYIRDSRTTS